MEEDRAKEKKKALENDGSKALSELEKYWQVVRENPSDFAGWTYLLHYVEQENNIEAAREAFNAFFQHYPYCYGYWKKFADMEKNLNDPDAAHKVFEEGANAVPLSVDLWIHFINFYKTQCADKEDSYDKIKELFQRSLDAAGTEFRSDRLWDLYVNWEEDNKNLKEVTAAYDRLLTIPTQLYSHHFEKFKKHVKKYSPREILPIDEFLELRQKVVILVKNSEEGEIAEDDADDKLTNDKPAAEDALPPGIEADEAPPGMETEANTDKDMMSPEELELMRKKIIDRRKVMHEKNEIEVGKRWSFEEGIKRPYFHVKPLERTQLKNWKDYLDYEVDNGTHENIVILFERCMIACALYEDMWLKYAKYMEEHAPNEAGAVYQRACEIHLPKKPSIHFSWASYEEKRGNIEKAADILDSLGQSISDMLEITIRKINLERRRSNHDQVEQLYTHCIATAKTSQMSSHFATKFARYLYKVRKDFPRATQILKDALKNDPTSPYLFMQLVDVGYQSDPVDIVAIRTAFDLALLSDMNNEQKLLFSQRKLEFLEDFSPDPQGIQDAYEEYAKMFKTQYNSRKRANDDSTEEAKDKKAKMEVNGTAATSAVVAPATAVPAHDAATYQYQHNPWVNYAQNSYNYQQPWAPYHANYYSSH